MDRQYGVVQSREAAVWSRVPKGIQINQPKALLCSTRTPLYSTPYSSPSTQVHTHTSLPYSDFTGRAAGGYPDQPKALYPAAWPHVGGTAKELGVADLSRWGEVDVCRYACTSLRYSILPHISLPHSILPRWAEVDVCSYAKKKSFETW